MQLTSFQILQMIQGKNTFCQRELEVKEVKKCTVQCEFCRDYFEPIDDED